MPGEDFRINFIPENASNDVRDDHGDKVRDRLCTVIQELVKVTREFHRQQFLNDYSMESENGFYSAGALRNKDACE